MSDHNKVSNISCKQAGKMIRSYVLGFIVSVALILIAFCLVMKGSMTPQATFILISFIAIVLLVVQLLAFMRWNTSTDSGWNLVSFLFAVVVIMIVVTGSLWIMYNLNYNMVH